MPQNRSYGARRARKKQAAGSSKRYTELLPGAPAAADAPAGSVSVTFVLWAPSETASERLAAAQVVADAWSTLSAADGTEYPAAATVMVLDPEQVPGHIPLMAQVEAARWSTPRAVEEGVRDLRWALDAAVAERWPEQEQGPVSVEVIGHQRFTAAQRLMAEMWTSSAVTAWPAGLGHEPQGNLQGWPAVEGGVSGLRTLAVTRGGEEKTAVVVDASTVLGGEGVLLVDAEPGLPSPEEIAAQPVPAGGWPHRLVDGQWQGWVKTNDGLYRAAFGFKRDGLEVPWTYDRIVAERGPARPVGRVEGDDSAERLAALWERAGRRAVTSTLVGAYLAVRRFPDAPVAGPHPLAAGREGSWESPRLLDLAWTVGGDLEEGRASRFDRQVAVGVADVLEGWARHPEVYTEVAAHLGDLFGRFAEQAGGWPAVADQWLQPGARIGNDPQIVHLVGTWLLTGSPTLLQDFLNKRQP